MEAGGTTERDTSAAADSEPVAAPTDGSGEEKETRDQPASPEEYQDAIPADTPRRIHIVGTGSIGKLVAHSLRGLPNPPPVTLVFHRFKLIEAWERSKRQITLQENGDRVWRRGFDVEWAPPIVMEHEVAVDLHAPDFYELAEQTGLKVHQVAAIVDSQRKEELAQGGEEPDLRQIPDQSKHHHRLKPLLNTSIDNTPIHNLIVATKTIRTIPALMALKHRISRDTTICFLQNGMGVIDDVNTQIFPDEATRPTYMQGVVTHGANVPPERTEQDPFFVVHAGQGTIALGVIPRDKDKEDDKIADTARCLSRTITRSPVLCAVAFTHIELLQLQLEKLAVNCVLNPLTVLLDNRNGSILYNYPLTRTMRLMLAEISLVIRSLPELQGIPNVPHRFSAERLETLAVQVAFKTKDNISSMLADVRAGRETEIEYINGYIVKRGEELGITCVVNYTIMQAVIGKCLMIQREEKDEVPTVVNINRE